MRNQARMSPSNSPSPLSIHNDSQTISKSTPKIRIIHVFAPEIIKTDVANFRELVQRLTGKPPQEKGCQRKPRFGKGDDGFRDKPATAAAKKVELRTGFLAGFERVKGEEGIWGENSGGFLSAFGDFDGLIQLQELGVGGDQFPLLPLDASHHMHGFEEAQPIA